MLFYGLRRMKNFSSDSLSFFAARLELLPDGPINLFHIFP